MNILSLEAGGAHIAIAALKLPECSADEDLAVLVTWSSDDTRSLSRELVGRIAQVLDDAQWKLSDVDALAVGLGPGSWTSLRVVLATAKTLAQARGWKLCGVPTFDAIARAAHNGLQHDASSHDALSHGASSTRLAAETVEEQAPPAFHDGLIVVASQSRADEIYSKIWRVQNGIWEVVQSESVQSPAELAAGLGLSEPILVAGDAREVVIASLQAPVENAVWPVEVSAEETVVQIGRLAAIRLARGDADDPLSLQPLYVAPSAAERVLEQRNQERLTAQQAASQ